MTLPSVENCEGSAKYGLGLNAQWYMLAVSISNFHHFITDLQWNIEHRAIQPLRDSIGAMSEVLNPVELSSVRVYPPAFGRRRLTLTLPNTDQDKKYRW